VITPPLYTYHSMWQSVIQDVMFTFRVRACQDIYVAMSGLLGVADRETYELIIGSCYVSFIRDAVSLFLPIRPPLDRQQELPISLNVSRRLGRLIKIKRKIQFILLLASHRQNNHFFRTECNS